MHLMCLSYSHMQMVLILAVSLVDKCFDVHHKSETKKILNVQENSPDPRTTITCTPKEDDES